MFSFAVRNMLPGVEVFPSSSIVNEPYNQGNTIQMNAWNADLGVKPGNQRGSGAQRTAAPL
jgi:hypothetical protein